MPLRGVCTRAGTVWPANGAITVFPGRAATKFRDRRCYCGKSGCIETWISGTALGKDYERQTGTPLSGKDVAEAADRGDAQAAAAIRRLEDRIARGFASLVNVIDPDVIVVGGGLSRLGSDLPQCSAALERYGFGGGIYTPIVPARHGDSSGVRGAAWLWPDKS